MRKRVETQAVEPPCIWALAGVLADRPCDQGYDCEHCELFHALKGGARSTTAQPVPTRALRDGPDALMPEGVIDEMVNAQLARLMAGCELHLDRAYSPYHFWLRPLPSDLIEVGLDVHTLKVLQPVDDITLPHVGVLLKLDEPCGWITRGRVAIPLLAPVTGEIDAVNDEYISGLREGEASAEVEHWLMRIRSPDDIDRLPRLYRGEDVLRWYLAKLELLKRCLQEAILPAATVGSTQADGGTMSTDLQEVLGQEAFEALVEKLFSLQI